jgi:hypothetical protein
LGQRIGWGRIGMTSTEPPRETVDLDVRLQDPTLLEEIDLYSELIIVAAASQEPLTTDAIDLALGLSKARTGG